MKVPCVKVKVLDKTIPKIAQSIYDNLIRNDWRGNIEESVLLSTLLYECGAELHPKEYYENNK